MSKDKFILEGVISYPKMIEGEVYEYKDKKTGETKQTQLYTGTLIIDKDKIDVKTFTAWIRSRADTLFGKDTKEDIRLKLSKCPVKDGDTWETEQGDLQTVKHPEYEGKIIVTMRTYSKPDVRYQDGSKVEEAEDNSTRFYGGTRCKVCVRIAKTNKSGKPWIRIEPSSVLSFGEGERLSTKPVNNADDDFAEEYDNDFSAPADNVTAADEDEF